MKCLISLIFSLILILFLEVLFRAFFVDKNLIDNWGYNQKGLGDLLPNKNFVASEVDSLPYRVITNSEGLRNTREVKNTKPNLRVLTIGDSFTFGPYVNNQDSYPAKLELLLNEASVEAEVLNAGVSGYTLKDQYEYLIEKGLRLDPDLLIVEIYENDVSDYQDVKRNIFGREKQKETLNSWPIIFSLLKKSAITTFVEERLRSSKINDIRQNYLSQPKSNLEEEFSLYNSDLEKLLILLQSKKIQTVFLLIPSYEQLINQSYFPQEQIKTKLESQFKVIDMLPIFKSEKYLESLYLLPLNHHLSTFGNYVVARAVYDNINPK